MDILLELILLKENNVPHSRNWQKQADQNQQRRRNLYAVGITLHLVTKEHMDVFLWVIHKLTNQKPAYLGGQTLEPEPQDLSQYRPLLSVRPSVPQIRATTAVASSTTPTSERQAKPGADTKWKLSVHKSHINPIEFLKMIDSTESTN